MGKDNKVVDLTKHKAKKGQKIIAKEILEMLDYIGLIPMPMDMYKNLLKKFRGKKKLSLSLPFILALLTLEYNINGRNLDLVKGEEVLAKIDDHVFFMRDVISEFYDLDNPVMDPNKPFYWFKVSSDK